MIVLVVSISENSKKIPCEIRLQPFGMSDSRLNLYPGEAVYFQIIGFVELYAEELWVPIRSIDRNAFDYFQMAARSNMYGPAQTIPRFAIPSLNGGYSLNPPIQNDKVTIEVAIRSEDNPAMYALFEVTRQERFIVKLIAHGLILTVS